MSKLTITVESDSDIQYSIDPTTDVGGIEQHVAFVESGQSLNATYLNLMVLDSEQMPLYFPATYTEPSPNPDEKGAIHQFNSLDELLNWLDVWFDAYQAEKLNVPFDEYIKGLEPTSFIWDAESSSAKRTQNARQTSVPKMEVFDLTTRQNENTPMFDYMEIQDKDGNVIKFVSNDTRSLPKVRDQHGEIIEGYGAMSMYLNDNYPGMDILGARTNWGYHPNGNMQYKNGGVPVWHTVRLPADLKETPEVLQFEMLEPWSEPVEKEYNVQVVQFFYQNNEIIFSTGEGQDWLPLIELDDTRFPQDIIDGGIAGIHGIIKKDEDGNHIEVERIGAVQALMEAFPPEDWANPNQHWHFNAFAKSFVRQIPNNEPYIRIDVTYVAWELDD